VLDAAAQLFFGEAREPAFHQVEPGSAGRREVEMKARMTQQPTLEGRGLVGGVIVDDQMERAAARDLVVNGLQELAELHRPMAAMKLPDHGARLEVERGEQVGSAVTQIVGSTPFRLGRGAAATAADCDRVPGAGSSRRRTTPARGRAD